METWEQATEQPEGILGNESLPTGSQGGPSSTVEI